MHKTVTVRKLQQSGFGFICLFLKLLLGSGEINVVIARGNQKSPGKLGRARVELESH